MCLRLSGQNDRFLTFFGTFSHLNPLHRVLCEVVCTLLCTQHLRNRRSPTDGCANSKRTTTHPPRQPSTLAPPPVSPTGTPVHRSATGSASARARTPMAKCFANSCVTKDTLSPLLHKVAPNIWVSALSDRYQNVWLQHLRGGAVGNVCARKHLESVSKHFASARSEMFWHRLRTPPTRSAAARSARMQMSTPAVEDELRPRPKHLTPPRSELARR